MEELASINRRIFLKRIGVASAGVLALPLINHAQFLAELEESGKFKKLTVLHTNDMHSRIEAFPKDHKKYPSKGGMLPLSIKIEEIRKQQGEILLLDAGDVFQGTPYFNEFGGEVEFKVMSALKYDVGTIGNHDFDNGVEALAGMLKFANFPLVNTNYEFGNTALSDKIEPYTVLEKQGVKIGVFGVGVELEGLVSKVNHKGVAYNDPIEAAVTMSGYLRSKKDCDVVICLSHLGYDYKNTKVCDKDLAQKTSGIDLIIGGHTHTFLSKAEVLKNKIGESVIVNQAGWSALSLGRVDLILDKQKSKIDKDLTAVAIAQNYTTF